MRKKVIAIILALAMIVTFTPTINTVSAEQVQGQTTQAEDAAADAEDVLAGTDKNGDMQKETAADINKADDAADATGGDQSKDPGDDQDKDAGNGQKKDAGKDESAEDSSNDSQTGPAKAPARGEPSRATISGDVSNGWIWKVSDSETGYTLTFEYTGTAATPPNFEVPNNFISNISSSLGSLTKNDITEIIVPERCTRIGTYAFQDMDGITRVELPSTLKTIDNVAFGDNNNDTDAPLGCGKLREVIINTNADGKSELEYVGARAFNGCKALKTIENLDKTNLRYIGYGGFMNVAVEEFYIPDSIAMSTSTGGNSNYQIGQYAFARNNSLKKISLPALFYIPYTTGTYTMAYCPKLEDVEFREVEGATVKGYSYDTLPSSIFVGDTNLKNVDLSVWEKATRSSSFSVAYSFTETSSTNSTVKYTELESFILPKKNITVGNYSFYNKEGINSWDQLENNEYITSIGERAFYGTRLESGDMSDMTRLTSIGMEAFKNCEDMVDLVIPEKVTTIGSAAFKNCDNLETVRIEAAQLTSVSYSNMFHGDDNLKSVTISDNTKRLNGNVLASIPEDADTFFEGENVIEITKATAKGGNRPLKGMNGKYYVDPQGVVYKLDEENNTAALAYVPPEITSYTVPEKITTPGDSGQDFTVNAINAYALNLADDLTSITFAAPENIYLMPSAFTGWSKSNDNMGKLVNGKEAIDPDDGWARISSICDFPIKDEDEGLVPYIEDTILNSDGEPALEVAIVVNQKDPADDNTYDYKTGQKASYMIAISNQDNVVMNKVVRVYFSYSDEGYNMGTFTPGEKPIVAPNGHVYPCNVVQTDDPNVYYYEITGLEPGDTVAVENDIFYSSPDTGGGEVKIWTHTFTPEEAAASVGDIYNPNEYMELDWETSPVEFNYRKTNTTVYDPAQGKTVSPIIKVNEDEEAYVSSLAYTLAETNTGSSSTTEGLDYIRWVNYEDEITLPEELYWREEIIDAINAGRWSVENTTTYYNYNGTSTMGCKAITVNVGGKNYYVAYLGKPGGYDYSYIDNLKVKITDEGKLKLTWKMSNTSLSGASATNEYSVQTFYLRIGDDVLLADLDKVNELLDEHPEAASLKDLLKLHNDTDEIRHYSYSDNQTSESGIDTPIDANYDVDITKEFQTNNNSSTSVYGGKDDFFNITINNTGILNLNTWGKGSTDSEGNKTYNGNVVHDELSTWFYIMPANIEKMLKAVATVGKGQSAQAVNIGEWLTIKIDKASLFTEDQYQPVDGTDQTNKYTSGSNSNITYGNDNGRRALETATITFKVNAMGQIQATLTGDPKTENNRTYVIGPGGDYISVEEFFNAIGYMPTYSTRYILDYTVPEGEDFTLKAGQKLVFPLLTTYKTTPMLLTQDRESYYSSSSQQVSNNATVSLKTGKTDVSRNVYPFYKSGTNTYQRYHYWNRELYFYKDGYIENGSSITSSTNVPDGTVIDSRLYFYNYSNRAYEHMPVSDFMDGPQVALAPVSQNPGLTAPDGSALETYTSNGVTYYLLNKPGEYKNVVFGSSSGRNGAQTLVADIEVSQTKSGGKVTSLNTLTKWKPYENWGATTTTTYIYYKTLVSAAYAGMTGSDNPGEVEQYTLNNKGWLGDHQGHRLWDTYGMYTRQYSFNKYIVSENGKGDGTDTVADGTLVKSSRVRQSDTVTYQIEINSVSDSPSILSGNNIRDVLPKNYGVFNWEKGVNVKNLRYYGTEGVEIKYGTGDDAQSISTEGEVDEDVDDYWSIVNTTTSGVQQISWDSNFKVNFPSRGKLKILVDITFPERPEDGASPWDRYVAANAGNSLQNTFYLFGTSSYAEHQLESEGKAVLYKGVADTGLTTRYNGSTSTSEATYTTNNTRLMYENGTGSVTYSDSDLKASTITYYTVLYNGSYDRLYLSDLQDQLPRGFTFNSMCNTAREKSSSYSYKYINTSTSSDSRRNWTNTSETYSTSNNYVGYTAPNGRYTSESLSEGFSESAYKLVTIDNSADEYDNNTVKYINARVVASTTNGADGRQHISFTIKGNPSSANSSGGIIKYDSEVGKYYLNPGEAIRFGYNVLIDKYDKTDDLATNTITMPYYDYYKTGFILDAPDEDGNGGAVQKARAVSGITPNDGSCEMMTGEDVADQFGVDTSKYPGEAYSSLETGNYMVSSVSVNRANITPGVQKTIGGLTGKQTNPGATTIEGSLGSASASALYGTAYKGGAKSSDVINWKVRVFNEAPGKNEEASGMMTGYTITDTMDAPYKFTGQVFYNMYKAGTASGTKVTSSSQYLFTIGSRKASDTKIRFSTGSSLSASGYRDVNIGSAEDDSDDDWFTFGTGAKAGRVKLEKNSEGQEVMTIEMNGEGYSIPAGYWSDFCVHTMYPGDDVVISDTKYNDVILYPEQGYDPEKVAQGRARTKQEYDESGELVTRNDGIESGASITITQGYTTSAWKKITEIEKTSNTARSDESNNYIALSEKTKNFKYDLYVIGPQDIMSKIVIIDDLPHIGDHSAFVVKDQRYSEFSVGFLEDDLDLKVSLAKTQGGTETVLDESQYEAYVTTRTEFHKSSNKEDDDWEGYGPDWTLLNGLSDEEKAEVLKTAKSIRIVIKDPQAWIKQAAANYLMGVECQVHVSFNARINDENAEPGQYAWNSFGYKYQVPKTQNGTEENSFAISLEAQPLNVGIKYPSAPILKKKLTEENIEIVVDEETGEETEETVVEAHKAEEDIEFGFIIYEGESLAALNDSIDMTNSQIAAALEAAERSYIFIPLEVKAGESEAEKGLWTVDYCSEYDPDNDEFVDSEDKWAWEHGKEYSLAEVNMGGKSYNIDTIKIGDNTFSRNNISFVNSTDTKIALTADNRRYEASGDITFKGTKSIDCRDLLDNESYEFTVMEGDEVIQTVTSNGAEYDEQGKINFEKIEYVLGEDDSILGEHTYTIKETKVDKDGVKSDTKTYTVTVNVTDNGDGTLEVEKTSGSDDPEKLDFENTYEAKGSITFEGTKSLDFRELLEGEEYTFTVKEGDKVIQTVKNDGADGENPGKINFEPIEYEFNDGKSDLGKHTYTIEEEAVDENGVVSDTKTYEVIVNVTDNKDGTLNVAVDEDSDDPEELDFVNKYEAEGEILFEGIKSISGRNLLAGEEYAFTIMEDGEVIQTVTSNGADSDEPGKINFEKITYKLDEEHDDRGVHTYTVKEEMPDMGGISVDDTEYTVRIEVTDNGNGTLTATALEDSDDPEKLDFNNPYEAQGIVDMPVKKILEGRDWTGDDSFSFTMTAEDGAPMPDGSEDGSKTIEITKNTPNRTESFGNILYTVDDLQEDGEYVKEKTFRYTIRENIPEERDKNMTYDENLYVLEVTVTDTGDGLLEKETNLSGEAEPVLGENGELEITNVFTPPEIPDEPDNPDNPGNPDEGTSTQTGDDSNMMLPFMIMLISATLLLIMLAAGRRRRYDD